MYVLSITYPFPHGPIPHKHPPVLPANILVAQYSSQHEDRALIPFLSILTLCSILVLIDTHGWEYGWGQYLFGASVLFAILNALEGGNACGGSFF